ncbi:MAG: hypothetical protein IKT41_00700 [Clostridia bacterium]|nr:hypothetical protein [Clostridia bacterium]
MSKNNSFNCNKHWKENNKEYLWELQKFLDKAENIKDDELKRSIINQMLKCDKTLTKIAEDRINKIMYKI